VVKRPPGEPPNVPSRNAPCAARAHPSRRGDSLSARGMKMLQDGIDQTEIAVGSGAVQAGDWRVESARVDSKIQSTVTTVTGGAARIS